MNIGVLASHNGTNLQAIIDASENKKIKSKVAIVISNNSKSGAIERAKKHNIPTAHLSGQTHKDPHNLDEAILNILIKYECDIVLLAGYMKKLGHKTLRKYQGKIINIHPALLPKYGGEGMFGMNVHNAVIKNQEKESGISIHLVDENYDTGKIIAQTIVAIEKDETPETLCDKIMIREHEFIVETIKKIETNEIQLEA